jgi:hypothetical protein
VTPIRYLLLLCCLSLLPAAAHAETTTIYIPANGPAKVRLAAQEIRRYFFLRTGVLPEIKTWNAKTALSEITFFLLTGSDQTTSLPAGVSFPKTTSQLEKDGFFIKTVSHEGKKIHLIIGGDESGVLYGAYAFAEQMGVRFYLHGDVVPDAKIEPKSFSATEKTGKPLFSIRGIQPFHDFPEGPDWWTEDDYRAVFSQLPKLKMNFFGLHTYPEGGVGPEPLVWIGLKEEIDRNGNVKSSYRSRHFTNVNGTWGYVKRLTSAYSNRLGDLFEEDVFGTTYMKGIEGWPTDAQHESALFNKTGSFFSDVFRYARDLGIRTCVGTETPLIVPAQVKERLKSKGINPDDPATTQLLYEGMFEWVKRRYPVDYYWFWTPEDWTWRQNTPEELQKTKGDLEAAMRAAKKVGAPFTLATCGWVLGPANDRSFFDQFLPKTWPMSCINRYVGFEPIEADFARTRGRPLWAIPWLEDDPALLLPQLWAGRMRRDAVDAAAYGCTGLIGIHWRTRTLGPNVSALAAAAWEQTWNPRLGVKATPEEAADRKKSMNLDYPVEDFYRDWAEANFGQAPAGSLGRIFSKLDGGPVFMPGVAYNTSLPRPADWMDGPGGVKPDTLLWDKRKNDYRFIEELEQIRGSVEGEGNQERFDYWLNTFKYLRAVGEFACTAGEIKRLIQSVQKEPEEKRAVYWESFVQLRRRHIAEMERAFAWLVRSISTKGDLGTVANWQQHIREMSIERPAKEIEKLMGMPLPAECWPGAKELDVRKMIVPTVRTALRKGEALRLQALFYGDRPRRVTVRWRTLGRSAFEALDFEHAARNVYTVSIPTDKIHGDFEYYIDAEGIDGTRYLFPVTTPKINQTVVVY